MQPDLVLVVDYGAQYAQLIARRVREAHVYSEIVPHTASMDELLARRPKAIILSGGPSSVYAPEAPQANAGLFAAGVPVFGICYGFQAMAQALGGEVANTGAREFGRTTLSVSTPGVLLRGLPAAQQVWMSHGDEVSVAPPGFVVTARTSGVPVAAFEDVDRRLAGVQFHAEVLHTEHGQQILRRYLYDIAGVRPQWTEANIIDEQVSAIQAQVGGKRVICGLSGGVDSAVAAALVQRDFVAATGVRLKVVDATGQFLDALAGVTEPEEKRKAIGREFIRVFETAAREIVADAAESVEFLVQGTLYPDVVESGGGTGAANIKSHHNVGGLPDDLRFGLIEPLRSLFKDEVRRVGEQLGLPAEIVWRQPFPGPGLAIRIVGEVTAARLDTLRRADVIAREELSAAGLDNQIWQCPVVLLADVRSVGVQGDGRTYGHPVVLRPVTSADAMTADWTRVPYEILERISTRITNEIREINRVVLDLT